METHIPVLFLDLKRNKVFIKWFNVSLHVPYPQYNVFFLSFVATPADDLSSQDQFEMPEAGGLDATLSGEDEDDFFDLQIVKHYDGEVKSSSSLNTRSKPKLSTRTCSNDSCGLAGESRGIMGLYYP